MNDPHAVEGLMYLFLILILYMGPTEIALLRGHRNALAIFALNLLLGWTVLGWIAAIIWSLTADVRSSGERSALERWEGKHIDTPRSPET